MDRILRRVSVVLAAVDACTGQAVDYRQCRAGVADGRMALAKPGGFFVLTDLPDEPVSVWIGGKGYQTVELNITGKDAAFFPVFLLPTREQQSVGRRITALSGRCSGKKLTVLTQRKGTEGRIAADAKQGERTLVLYPSQEIREGRQFYLLGENGAQERIVLQEENEQEGLCYTLEEPLKYSYQKGRTLLCSLFDVPVEADGSYYLPFSLFPEENGRCRVWVDGKEKPVSGIREGQENRQDY
ncbi:MAG: hypothetical protein J6B10_02980 [Lachnospiraceae bacterium]|nr:hypothetical protein [Lachnospiraceae bacterium]